MAEIFNHQYSANGEYCGPSTIAVNSNYQWAWLPIVAACNGHCNLSVLDTGGVLLVYCRLTLNGNGFTPLPVWLALDKHTRQYHSSRLDLVNVETEEKLGFSCDDLFLLADFFLPKFYLILTLDKILSF